MATAKPLTRTSALLLRVFLPFAIGYFLSNLYRVVNAVIAGLLESDVGVGAAELGLLTSAYFLAFTCCQLPIGVLLDRFGPRRVEALLLLVAGVGSVVFAVGQDLASLMAGRLLIGIGASACLMASFKAFSLWFDSRRLALANGCVMAFGGLGAVTATAPVEAFVSVASWRVLFVLLAGFCLATSLLLWLTVPERDRTGPAEPLAGSLRTTLGIVRHRAFWAVAPAAFASHGLGLAAHGLWAGPWLRDVAGLDSAAVAQHLLWMAAATVVGPVAWATFADRLHRRGVTPLQIGAAGTALFWLTNIVVAAQPSQHQFVLWLLYGFTASTGSLFFAGLVRCFAGAVAGRVNAAVNLAIFAGAFALQWGLGVVIQAWDQPGVGYDPQGYRIAFATAAVLQGLALAWLLLSLLRGSASGRVG